RGQSLTDAPSGPPAVTRLTRAGRRRCRGRPDGVSTEKIEALGGYATSPLFDLDNARPPSHNPATIRGPPIPEGREAGPCRWPLWWGSASAGSPSRSRP